MGDVPARRAGGCHGARPRTAARQSRATARDVSGEGRLRVPQRGVRRARCAGRVLRLREDLPADARNRGLWRRHRCGRDVEVGLCLAAQLRPLCAGRGAAGTHAPGRQSLPAGLRGRHRYAQRDPGRGSGGKLPGQLGHHRGAHREEARRVDRAARGLGRPTGSHAGQPRRSGGCVGGGEHAARALRRNAQSRDLRHQWSAHPPALLWGLFLCGGSLRTRGLGGACLRWWCADGRDAGGGGLVPAPVFVAAAARDPGSAKTPAIRSSASRS